MVRHHFEVPVTHAAQLPWMSGSKVTLDDSSEATGAQENNLRDQSGSKFAFTACIISYGRSKEIGAQGINMSQILALIDPLGQCIAVQLPQSCHLRSPWGQASKEIILVGLGSTPWGPSSMDLSPEFNLDIGTQGSHAVSF